MCCCDCGVSWALVVCFWGCSSSPCAPGTAAHQEMPAQKTLKHINEVVLYSCTDVEELARADAHEPDGAPPPRRAPTPADRRAAPRPRERRAAEPAGLARRARADAAAARGQQAALRRRPQSHGAPARAAHSKNKSNTPTDAQVVGGPNARRDYHLQTGEEFFLQLSGELCLKIVERGRFKDVRVGAGQTFLRVPPASQRSKGKQTVFPAGCRATCRTRRSAPRGRSASSLKDPTRPRRWTACSGSTRPRT